MKMIYVIIGLLVIGGLAYYMRSYKNKSQANEKIVQQDPTQRKKVDPKSNPYNDLRNLAFGVNPEQIGVQLPTDKTKIYGVIMDWDLTEGTATLVAFLSGDASLYLSSGGGVIGGVGHENVKLAVESFIAKAEGYLTKTTKTETTPLPDKDCVRFYLLTNKGHFVAQEQMKNFKNNSSEWLNLFEEGNKVITEIRKSSPTK